MKHNLIERCLVGILLLIAALIVVHAPLTVWLGTVWPDYRDYIKAWKELLMGAALLLLLIESSRRKKIAMLLHDRLVQLALVYAGLHLVLVAFFQNGLGQASAGLLIDLRYLFYFVLVYATMRLLPQYRRLFIWVFASGAAVVLTFAMLQVFVLPKDVLGNIGYSKQTIAPYLTVDENPAYIRINSTLRGPNPLGAYVTIIIGLLAAFALRWRVNARGWVLGGGAALMAGITLGASYSRSSVIGAVVALIIVGFVATSARTRKHLGAGTAVLIVLCVATIVALRDTPFVSNIVLHDNPSTGAAIDSNTGHASSLIDGLALVLRLPFGGGVGSAGSASLIGDNPLIIENQYLLIAHEVGWLGLALYVWLFVEVMRRLWDRRKSALALGVFGSGVGLTIIGLMLPVWTDDTVSIVWWGLAAIAIGSTGGKYGSRKNN